MLVRPKAGCSADDSNSWVLSTWFHGRLDVANSAMLAQGATGSHREQQGATGSNRERVPHIVPVASAYTFSEREANLSVDWLPLPLRCMLDISPNQAPVNKMRHLLVLRWK